MSFKLIAAITAITLALVFYTIGVFGERRSKSLNKTHLILFWLGLICDTTGTITMSKIAKSGIAIGDVATQTLHGLTGFLAIVLMLFHALWATYVLIKNDEKRRSTFHKFSIVVWIIWLVPYAIGMMIGMGR